MSFCIKTLTPHSKILGFIICVGGKKVEREQESEVQFRTGRATYAGAEVVGAEHHAIVVEASAVSEAAGFLAHRLQKKHHSH